MGGGESSTPCAREHEEVFELAIHVLSCFKGHLTPKAVLGDASEQDELCLGCKVHFPKQGICQKGQGPILYTRSISNLILHLTLSYTGPNVFIHPI